MTIPETLEKYLYGEIVPRYAAFDAAHREDHALTVMEQSMKLLADRSGGGWPTILNRSGRWRWILPCF